MWKGLRGDGFQSLMLDGFGFIFDVSSLFFLNFGFRFFSFLGFVFRSEVRFFVFGCCGFASLPNGQGISLAALLGCILVRVITFCA